MANLLRNDKQHPDKLQSMLNGYNSSRSNLMLVAFFSTINIVLLATNSFVYFLFSAAVPYILVDEAMYSCGFYPEEYYPGGYDAYNFFDQTFFVLAMVIAVIIIAIYIVLNLTSKKVNPYLLIAALVLFSADTVAMFVYYGFDTSMIIDIVFHVYVIGSLSYGIYCAFKIKQLPADDEIISITDENIDEFATVNSRTDSPTLRIADTSVKARVFLETNAFGHNIIYRRVKRTNELVIDGRVYGEYTALLEMPHMLNANKDGHAIAAGIGADSKIYIMIDGKTVATKLRFV